MTLWSLSFFLACAGVFSAAGCFSRLKAGFGPVRQKKALRKVAAFLREIEEMLQAGLVPNANKWADLQLLPDPWGSLAFESVQGLRACGGSIVPTLSRLRKLAQEQEQSLTAAQSKSSQALAQIFTCALLVPVLGIALYFLLPGVRQSARSWVVANGLAIALSGIGSLWVIQMSDDARWAGVRVSYRAWILGSQLAGERFLAVVRSGTPVDLAWLKVCEGLKGDLVSLGVAWGHSVWEPPQSLQAKLAFGPTEQSIVSVGSTIRKAVQTSLMEGRPCIDRVETALAVLRTEIEAHVNRELSLLSTRALKPLFICVAPGVMGLLAFGFWLIFQEMAGGAEGYL